MRARRSLGLLAAVNRFTLPAGEIGRIESVLTMVGGRIVHAAPPFSAR